MTQPPNNTTRTRIVVAVIGLLALAALGLYSARSSLSTAVRTVSGVITQLDVPTRAAAMEITLPRTGKTVEIKGQVAPDCEIRIDGAAGTLADLKVGDAVEVTGAFSRSRTVTAQRVLVRRAAMGSATQAAPVPPPPTPPTSPVPAPTPQPAAP